MYHDLWEIYWWNGMKRNIAEFVAKFSMCQQVKIEHQRPSGVMQEFSIPTCKWEEVNMDFLVYLLPSHRYHDSILVVIDRLTKSAYFFPVHSSYAAEYYARIYIRELIRLHGIPLAIISDRGTQFTSQFWKSFQKGLGTQIRLSFAFHLQIDGQAERII